MNRVTKRENRAKTKDKNNKGKLKKRRSFGKTILMLALIIVVCIGVNFGVKVYKNGGGLQGFLAATLGQDIEKLQDLDTMYVLVLGVSEDLDSKLTDTIILCGYNPKQQKATMLSIPRDTFIGKNKNSKSGFDKINALYSKGPEKTVEAVAKLTGIDVKNYVVVNNNALIKMVDVIGGVQFDVPIDMDYDDKTQNLHIHLKKGMQTINGEKAEQLLRFRHSNPDKNGVMTTYPESYGTDDYGRMRTQREFITETIKQTISLKNVTKLKQITETIFENIETNLTLDEILPYVPWAVNFNPESINSKQLPGASDNPNGVWFFYHNKKETEELVEEMKDDIEGIVKEEATNTVDTNTTSAENTSKKNTNSTNTSKKSTNTSKTNTTKK
ncbi:MAG: LCP family protein [Clostridia bacterium]|nr:LCP family protein [Clostridia bacterium]